MLKIWRNQTEYKNVLYIIRITEIAKAHRLHSLCAYALFQEDELY